LERAEDLLIELRHRELEGSQDLLNDLQHLIVKAYETSGESPEEHWIKVEKLFEDLCVIAVRGGDKGLIWELETELELALTLLRNLQLKRVQENFENLIKTIPYPHIIDVTLNSVFTWGFKRGIQQELDLTTAQIRVLKRALDRESQSSHRGTSEQSHRIANRKQN
jgi:hypothetical protein